MFYPKDIMSLRLFIKKITEEKLSYYVIGNGTNLLINDRHFDEVFINLKDICKIGKINKKMFFIPSGINSSKAALFLAKKGYKNAEFLSIIPGTIGGAIYMNAGAYNSSISDIIKYVLYLDPLNDLILLKKEDCMFDYRTSIFSKRKGIILGAIIEVDNAKFKYAPLEKIKTLVKNKKETQPLNTKCAGSTFKNPKDMASWEIVERLGFKGTNINDAYVSNKHANFIINNGNATFDDIYTLIKKIKKKAKEDLDIDLEYEWKILE